jgi:acyl-coenzyme A synthetase/AMP-(fatty) acid ligase
LGHEIVAIEIEGVLCVANLQANIEIGVLRNSIAEYLDIHKSGIEVRLFDFVPRNESGKIRYAELEKIWNSFQ